MVWAWRSITCGLGSAPAEEECAQVGIDEDYAERAHAECIAYKRQLERVARAAGKEIPEGAKLIIKSQSHDYGTYYEVVVRFDLDDERAARFAYWMEENIPGCWDEEARRSRNGGESSPEVAS